MARPYKTVALKSGVLVQLFRCLWTGEDAEGTPQVGDLVVAFVRGASAETNLGTHIRVLGAPESAEGEAVRAIDKGFTDGTFTVADVHPDFRF